MPIGQFLKEFVGEVLSLDSRLVHTLRPLFTKPGQVATEYVAGHRARFVPPGRLFVFASFAMFVMLAFTGEGTFTNTSGTQGADSTAVDSSGVVSDSAEVAQDFFDRVNERLNTNIQRATDQPGVFTDIFLNRLAQSTFILVPVFALFLKALYRKRLYIQHLIFAIYYHSFAFIFIAILSIPTLLQFNAIGLLIGVPRIEEMIGLLQSTVPVYLLFDMRRFYQEKWWKTLVKWAIVNLAYFVTLFITIMILLVLTLLFL